MAELKTKPNDENVNSFLQSIDNPKKKEDALKVLDLMRGITKEEPKMWGGSIVGFGAYHFIYESGREGDWFLTGFSPRKNALTLYIMAGFDEFDELLKKLGKFKTGKSCLYIKELEDIDFEILKKMISESVHFMKQRYL